MSLFNKLKSNKKLSLLSLVLLTLLVAREMGWISLDAYRSNTESNVSMPNRVKYWKRFAEVYEEVGPDGPRYGVRISKGMIDNAPGYMPDFGYRVQIQHDGEVLREVYHPGDDKLPTLEFLVDLETPEFSGLTWTPLFKSFDLAIAGSCIGPDRTSGAPKKAPDNNERRSRATASCSMTIYGPCARSTARALALDSLLDSWVGMLHKPADERDASASELNIAAWDRVDPDRRIKDTDVALALDMTRRAIELDPRDANIRDTHAWALLANGADDEALVQSAKAVELARDNKKQELQGNLIRMRRLIAAQSAGFPATAQGRRDYLRAMVEGWGEVDASASELNIAARDRVDPDRRVKDTDVALALRITRRAIELDPRDANIRDTHAWALLANDRAIDALIESAKALELANDKQKEKLQGNLNRMRRLIEARVRYDEAMQAFHATFHAKHAVVEEKLKAQRRKAEAQYLKVTRSGSFRKAVNVPVAVASYTGDKATPTKLLENVGRRNGTVHGQVVQVEGRSGQALRFDGDDHCRIPRVVENSFTVSFFVRTKQRGNGRPGDTRWFTGTGLVDGEIPGIVDDWGISWHSDGFISAGTGRPERFVASGPGYNDGEWHHVAFTRDQKSGRIVLYVDGIKVSEARGSKRPLTSPEDLVIGRMRPGGGGFKGDIDELKFYEEALTQPQVIALSVNASAELHAAGFFSDEQLIKELNALRRPKLETMQVLAVRDRGRDAPDAFIRLRGNVHAKGKKVPVGVPAMLGEPRLASFKKLERSSGRRTALANWITRPDNRLTWRVIANRLWQHHFGRGIVRSSNDFGRLGSLPTHPKLLDWLACEVLEQGQSLKAMHRVIMMSSTYRMSSQASEKGLAEDPLNDSFWRFNRRRLTAEEVRDSILTANGTINLELGGPSVYPPLPRAVLLTASRPDAAWGRSNAKQAARRSIYIHVKRSLPEPLLAAFDRADTDSSCPVRFATVQPTQALSMINGDFANLQAQRFADRLVLEQKDMASRLYRALQLVSQREPTKADLQRLQQLARELQDEFGRSELQALQRCCLVLLNCNEFLFLD